MKHGFIKVGAVSPKIRVADVENNIAACIEEVRRAAELGIKVLVFPELCITGATAGDLFYQKTLVSAAEEALGKFACMTAELDVISFIGLPVSVSSRLYNAVAAVFRGEILAAFPKTVIRAGESRHFGAAPEENVEITLAGQNVLFGADVILSADTVEDLYIGVCVGDEIGATISPAAALADGGATLIVNPHAAPEIVGRAERQRTLIKALSASTLTAIVKAESGEGESGTDGIFAARSLVSELGEVLEEAEAFDSDTLIYTDIDVERIASERCRDTSRGSLIGYDYEMVGFCLGVEDTQLSRKVKKSPFIPENSEELDRQCELILNIQARALANRLTRSYSTGAVVGVSGGLDSTLALLVAARAVDIAGLGRDKLIAVTMPCFGTTKRTKGNAEKLSEALGATLRCVDIKAAVNQHFADIGHDPDDYSVVYENAQARERTQVLMDIANASGALVVGTGDLSELALGWATYNGDHMSMYGVNAGIPKTLMRHIVAYSAKLFEKEGNGRCAEVLTDVLNTPVSPELLPPKDGEIAQCTEGIVGPYELHDFFIYYHVRYGFSPDKILRLAVRAFADEYDEQTVRAWLKVFVRRFFSQQFKRSCLPDGPKVFEVGFSPRGDFSMPSDAVGKLWDV
ncbi:MAG: NAD(+) synthase [Clostridia bacterium]|nr:NAD(+) synthase [Clostridia bacterium]